MISIWAASSAWLCTSQMRPLSTPAAGYALYSCLQRQLLSLHRTCRPAPWQVAAQGSITLVYHCAAQVLPLTCWFSAAQGLQACAWLSASSWSQHEHGDACLVSSCDHGQPLPWTWSLTVYSISLLVPDGASGQPLRCRQWRALIPTSPSSASQSRASSGCSKVRAHDMQILMCKSCIHTAEYPAAQAVHYLIGDRGVAAV